MPENNYYKNRGFAIMQHGNGISIAGALLAVGSWFATASKWLEQNTGVVLAIVGILSWGTGIYFQRRKDRREAEKHEMEKREHAHRVKLLENGVIIEAKDSGDDD